jgi:hypothetical protein
MVAWKHMNCLCHFFRSFARNTQADTAEANTPPLSFADKLQPKPQAIDQKSGRHDFSSMFFLRGRSPCHHTAAQ